jgi:hypothetical protein
MPILGVIASSYIAPVAAFESIQTFSGSASSITFSSIPQTYKHLQIRITMQATATFGGSVQLLINGDSSGNYSNHFLYGTGSGAGISAGAVTSTSLTIGLGLQQSGVNGVVITDILDYTSTNKYKVVRSLGGVDNNSTGGLVVFQSGALYNANGLSAISSLTVFPQSASFAANCSFALYGIKG